MSIFDNLSLPKVLYETESPHNGKITVIQVGKTRKLLVGGVSQSLNWDSPAAPRKVWGRVVEVLQDNQPSLKKVLVLGLGGGTMQHLISKAFPGVEIVSIELDKTMIDVATSHFNLQDIPNHKIINEDACRVIIEPHEHGVEEHYFDALIVDIYCGEKFPELGKSGNFITALKNMVIPEGLIIFNRIYLEHHQDDVNMFIDSLENFLTDVQSLVIAGVTNSDNVLIYGKA